MAVHPGLAICRAEWCSSWIPNFLSYSPTPIQITAVVRRDPANDPASLKLEYESTSGYKKMSPYEIPDDKTWNTVSWKINDAQFVSKWVFNFRFGAGNYYIKSVTVTKCEKETDLCP